MKLIYGGVPYNTTKVKHFEMDTNSATVQPSDMQAGVTCFARGAKVTGTGKSFEFACYGDTMTNMPEFIPTLINVVEISSTEYPIKSLIPFIEMIDVDFSIEQSIGTVVVNGTEYPITLTVQGNVLTFNCEQTVSLQFFYGRDNYI